MIKSEYLATTIHQSAGKNTSKGLLLKFLAHLMPPTFPQLRLSAIHGIHENKTLSIESRWHDYLFEAKLINSRGECFKEEDLKNPELVNALRKALTEESMDESTIKEVVLQFKNKIPSTIKKYKALIKLRDKMKGTNTYNILPILYASLSPTALGLSPEKLQQIKRCTLETISIINVTRQLKLKYKNKPSAFYIKLFEFSGKIIDSLWEHPRNIIIKTNNPIGKSGSTKHTFYVGFCFSGDADEGEITPIICNGGRGSKFHKPDPQNLRKKDNELGMLHYVQMNSFSLKSSSAPKNKKLLTEYLFSLLRMYTLDGKKKSNFCHLQKNIYIHPPHKEKENSYEYDGYIYGFDKKRPENIHGPKIRGFSRKVNPRKFLKQPTGNCPIHNFMHCIEATFSLTKLEYGLLEDTILIGFDNLLINLKKNKTIQITGAVDISGTNKPLVISTLKKT